MSGFWISSFILCVSPLTWNQFNQTLEKRFDTATNWHIHTRVHMRTLLAWTVHCAEKEGERRKANADNDDDDDDDTVGTTNNRIDCWHFGYLVNFMARDEM